MTLCIDCQAKVNSGEKGDCQVVFDNTSLYLGCMGYMWSCFPYSLYQSMVTDEKRMPSWHEDLGIKKDRFFVNYCYLFVFYYYSKGNHRKSSSFFNNQFLLNDWIIYFKKQ